MPSRTFVVALVTGFFLVAVSPAQQASPYAVPNLINYSGTLHPSSGLEALPRVVGVTFAIYRQEDGGAPLWLETQNVTPDSTGHYTVLLGSTRAEGVPAYLFSAQEERWLGVQMHGEAEQPRVLLVSVPYAMKAADAETIGGLPASAFVLAAPSNSATAATTDGVVLGSIAPPTSSNVTTTGGTANRIPVFTTATNIQNSILTQTGTTVTVGGNLSATGAVTGSSFKIGSNVFAFGSYANKNAFLGFAGNSTMTGLNNAAIGYQALYHNTAGGSNTAIGYWALELNTTGSSNTAIGYAALASITGSSGNTALGDGAGYSFVAPGSNNTFVGYGAQFGFQTNITNATAIGALSQVTANNAMVLGSINGVNGATANTNVGIGTTAPAATLHLDLLDHGATDSLLIGNTSSKGLQLFDAGTGVDIASYGVPLYINFAGNSTYLNVAGGNVGIGTSAPDNTLTVNGSADKPGGGSWGTFSDRRLKSLHGNYTSGLEQVLQLNPVRYRYTADNALGIHDSEEHIGLVAQDVQQVIPEAVTQDGKGYLLVNNDPILWAMLNAVKEQQQQIQRQQAENISLRGELVRLAGEMQEMRMQLQQVQAQSGQATGHAVGN